MTNCNHVPDALDCVLSHFHDVPLGGACGWDMEAQAQVSIFKKATKLRIFCCVKWLIGCQYPFMKILVELSLIKCLALCKRRKVSVHGKVNASESHALVSSA